MSNSAQPQQQDSNGLANNTSGLNELTRVILDNLLDGVIVIDAKGIIHQFTKPAERIFGFQANEVIGLNVSVLMPAHHAHSHDTYMDNYHNTGKAKIIGIGRAVEGKRKDGSLFPMDLAVTQIDRNGQRFYIGTIRDTTKQHEANQRIEFLSSHDALTGLPNRDKLILELGNLLAHSSVCVAAINLDFFNRINTVHGYAEGDAVLCRIATRLHNHVDANCIVARDLGDRFWVVMGLKESSINAGQAQLQQLLEVIRQPVQTDFSTHYVTGSAGVVISDNNATALELLSQAEAAVYQAKLDGRDCISLYEPLMRSKIAADYQLELSLRKGMDNGEIETWVQSKVDASQQVASAEALMRWRHINEQGQEILVSPAAFIPIAERLGLIVPMGRTMMDHVAQALGQLQAKPKTAAITIALNVSPRQFLDPDFCNDIRGAFARHQAPLSHLILEITENLLLKNLQDVHRIMAELSADGVSFSIDDFGTGYSNLKRLQQLPINEIKIDQSFVQGAPENVKMKAILDGILGMSKTLGLQTVAEGVEQQCQADYLIAQGCQFLQGYLYSRPAPLAEWLETVQDPTAL